MDLIYGTKNMYIYDTKNGDKDDHGTFIHYLHNDVGYQFNEIPTFSQKLLNCFSNLKNIEYHMIHINNG